MIRASFDDIALGDIRALVDNRVAERRTLEFKRDLPGGSNDARKEFIADITSFANAQGGDIVFGLAEANGSAAAIHGLEIDDLDACSRALEDRILTGADPRIPGVRLKWIAADDGKHLLLIRVPASASAPHRVIVAGSGKFFGRKGNGKYELDTQELREAFTATEALPARLRALHLEAVDTALRDELPAGLGEGPKAIVSVIPVNYFRDRLDLEITRENALAPFKPGGHMEASWIEATHGADARGMQNFTGLFTVRFDSPRNADALMHNPLGLFITEFSMSPETPASSFPTSNVQP